MKKQTIFLPLALTVLFVCLFACSKDDPDPYDGLFLPNFSNRWECTNNRNPGSLFFFNLTTSNSTAGTGSFTGNENKDGNSYNLTGSYTYENMQFHYLTKAENNNLDNGPDAGLTFKGLLDTTHPLLIMRLVNTTNKKDSLVLEQRN